MVIAYGAAQSRSRFAVDQAIGALRAGDLPEAQTTLRRHLLEQPDDVAALEKLTEIAIMQRRMDEATLLLRRAAVADPAPQRRLVLVRHLFTVAGPAVALAEVETLPHSQRQDIEVRALEAALLGVLGHHQRQLVVYESLTAENPRNPFLWMDYGNALNAVGRAEDAVESLRRAIAVRRSFGEAHWTLANFKSFRFSDRDVLAMRRALTGRLDDIDRLHFHFALGKALEDRRSFAHSFEHYASGNRIRAASLGSEETPFTAFVDLAVATFTRELFNRAPQPNEGKAGGPIFVVGLHRSGSTLIEQILASHPLIEGTGELPVLQQIWERLSSIAVQLGSSPFARLAQSDAAACQAIGTEYLARTKPFRRTGRPFFIDKLPGNWLNTGLIRLALPQARIVDARRHPMACGFSNFKQNYAKGVNFSYGLASIGRFYRDYHRLMDHFDAVQPGVVHHVVNERLIADPEGEVRRMLGYVGVPFDPACLDFHSNQRAVRTPSADQVRRPLNRDGIDAWRAFEPWLGPLKEALGPTLDDWLPEEPQS